MISAWDNITVTEIVQAFEGLPQPSENVHKNRHYHTLVFNKENTDGFYFFLDGTVLNTYGSDLVYLPKGSSYTVKSSNPNGCYAIKFQADIQGEPFSVNMRSREKLTRIFDNAQRKWRDNEPFCQLYVKKAIYEIILILQNEISKKYTPSQKEKIILPAIEKINSDFNKQDLSIPSLAKLCNISEVYLRRLFIDKFGVPPKKYIIETRINHAKSLIKSGMFSVLETARLCGYSDECHFSKEFKKRTGQSPVNYK